MRLCARIFFPQRHSSTRHRCEQDIRTRCSISFHSISRNLGRQFAVIAENLNVRRVPRYKLPKKNCHANTRPPTRLSFRARSLSSKLSRDGHNDTSGIVTRRVPWRRKQRALTFHFLAGQHWRTRSWDLRDTRIPGREDTLDHVFGSHRVLSRKWSRH